MTSCVVGSCQGPGVSLPNVRPRVPPSGVGAGVIHTCPTPRGLGDTILQFFEGLLCEKDSIFESVELEYPQQGHRDPHTGKGALLFGAHCMLGIRISTLLIYLLKIYL